MQMGQSPASLPSQPCLIHQDGGTEPPNPIRVQLLGAGPQ